jgi:hypothetical protein
MTWASDTRNQPLNASHAGRMDNHQGNGFSVLWNAPTRQTVYLVQAECRQTGSLAPREGLTTLPDPVQYSSSTVLYS